MKMKFNFISCLPSIFFLIGIIFLSLSPLTLSNAIFIQNDALIIFFQGVKENDVSKALSSTFLYLWDNVLWVIIIFLIIVSFGFLFQINFIEKINKKTLIISQFIFILLIIFFSKTIIMILTAFSLFIGTLWVQKTFEPKKSNFCTAYSVITSRLGLMSVFLCIGIFITTFINMETYEKEAYESNMNLMLSFIPNMSSIKEMEKEQIQQITEGFEYSLRERYNMFDEDTKKKCKPLYEGMIQGIESYKNRTVAEIESQEIGIEKELIKRFPFFRIFLKITPLLTAITAYALLTMLIPFLGIFNGVVYSTVKRMGKRKYPKRRKSRS